MQTFVAHSNIERFRRRLLDETDASIHATLRNLLLLEEDKLACDLEQLQETEDAIRALREHIGERARVEQLRGSPNLQRARFYLASLMKTLRVHEKYKRHLIKSVG